MNYEPNAVRWKKGDSVIHDADAKHIGMVMEVIGYTNDGLVKTRYVNRFMHGGKIYHNSPIFLHSLDRFGLVIDRWRTLKTTSDSGKLIFQCRTCGRKSVTPDKTCGNRKCDRS